MLNTIESIIKLHKSKGNIEDAYTDIKLDNKKLKLNIYTLRFKSTGDDREEIRKWNNKLNFELKQNRNLEKEIKEYRVLFEALEKLKINKGYVEKYERPDFILEINNKKVGIEITKIYSRKRLGTRKNI